MTLALETAARVCNSIFFLFIQEEAQINNDINDPVLLLEQIGGQYTADSSDADERPVSTAPFRGSLCEIFLGIKRNSQESRFSMVLNTYLRVK